MAKENKYQHFIPAAFLSRFSHEPDLKRKAALYRFDGKKVVKGNAGYFAKLSWFYTEDGGRESEEQGDIESSFFEVLKAIDDGNADLEFFTLHAGYLAARVPSVNVNEGEDRLAQIKPLGFYFYRRHILGMPKGSHSMSVEEQRQEARLEFQKNWAAAIITPDSASHSSIFLCSDNPVFVDVRGSGSRAVILPIGSRSVFVAVRKSIFRICKNEYCIGDANLLNAAQVHNAKKQIYYGFGAEDGVLEKIAEDLGKGEKVEIDVSDDGFDVLGMSLPVEELSFLEFAK